MIEDMPNRVAMLYALMPKDGSDISISSLFDAMYPDAEVANEQQRLGPHITRLNRRLKDKKERVITGIGRRTYRLVITK